jgi:Cys-rich four helix bundle protein (predicted Tat secretion target)
MIKKGVHAMPNDIEVKQTKSSYETKSLSRREVLCLAATASATATLASGVTFAASSEHDHHAHHSKNENVALIDSAFDCIKKGQLCMDHCMELFKAGDTSVADCADSVNEMLAMCTALTQMTAYRSSHLSALAKVCMDVCLDCEKKCREHEDKHAECKACADSCVTCADECEKLLV